jgi:hypothetical protein
MYNPVRTIHTRTSPRVMFTPSPSRSARARLQLILAWLRRPPAYIWPMFRWRISIFGKTPATSLGTVAAPDEQTARQRAPAVSGRGGED